LAQAEAWFGNRPGLYPYLLSRKYDAPSPFRTLAPL
jgi:hypothetical protein